MTPSRRIRFLLAVAWLVLAALATRLYALQVVRGDELRAKAERRRRRVEHLFPRRGRIIDAKGRVLALDRPAQDVVVELPDLDPALELVRVLAWATRKKTHEVAAAFREARSRARAGALTVPVGHAKDSAARDRVRKLATRFPGIETSPDPRGGFTVLAPAALVGTRDRTLERLAALLDQDAGSVRVHVQEREDEVRAIEDAYARHGAWNEPVVLARDVSFDEAAAVEEASSDLPGVAVLRRYGRTYPQGAVAAHVLGYLGALGEAETARLREDGLLVDDPEDAAGLLDGAIAEIPEGARLSKQKVGRAGLEAKLDERLAGLPGARVVERDAADRSRETLLCLPPKDGEDVRLTIDLDLQAAAEAALDESLAKHGDERAGGAAVLVSVATGEVLALASAPRYDPNELARVYAGLRANPASPLLHRAVLPAPPGSTFKVLSAFAFFGQDALSPETTFVCAGALEPGKKGSHFHCDAIHGSSVGLELAISHSCNVFFFRSADATKDASRLAFWAESAGFGKLASDRIPLERKGSFPRGSLASPAARRNAAIGQGDVLATPLQVARLAALVANGGRSPRARFLDSDEEGEERLALDPRVLSLVRAGLRGCVEHGTASKPDVGLRGLDVAGKTGTAERTAGNPNYAWFMGYYPASSPEVAFAALVDRTHGHGGDVCGPIARAIVQAYARSKGEEPKRR